MNESSGMVHYCCVIQIIVGWCFTLFNFKWCCIVRWFCRRVARWSGGVWLEYV